MSKHFLLLVVLALPFFAKTQELTQSEKIYGLSLAWEKAKTHFAHFDKASGNWDSIYMQSIPKVIETTSTKAYYEVLIQMYSLLNDGHTWIWYPDDINDQLNTIPIETKLVENKLIVSKILNDTLASMGLSVGDEIVKIDGIDAIEYGRLKVMPYVSSSTQQDRILRTYTYDIFLGDINKAVELSIKKHSSQKLLKLTISRVMEQYSTFIPYEYKQLKEGIAYLKINTFYYQKYKAVFDSLYQDILKSEALIIDLRNNGGGSGLQANYVLSHLIQEPVLTAKYKWRARTENKWEHFDAEYIKPQKDNPIYTKPVMLLIGPGTFSAAEDFCLAFDNAKRGLKIGSSTAGSTGNSLEFDLPGGGYGQVTFKRDAYPDGKEFVGYGIEADVVVYPTIEDIATEKDAVLNEAIERLR
ncbi:MAG: S41 family peptidase [Chitinophagales bacterium]|nr:S41 family peptidase [Chitinophagales bacterium]